MHNLSNQNKRNKQNRRIGSLGGISIALLFLLLIFSLLSPYFLTVNNIINVLHQTSIIALTGFGMTFVLIIAGIDLSIGSIIAFVGIIFSVTVEISGSILFAMIAGLTAGILFGLLNGILISKLSVPAFIVTLSTMGIFRGLTYSITNSKPVPIENPLALFLGNGKLFYIPLSIYIVIISLLVCNVLLEKTRFGRQARIIGGNREAARYIGVNIPRVEITIYALSGSLCAISGILLASRLYSAQPNVAQGYELDAIAAAVLGGTSLSGGVGSITGTFIGAFIIGIINNGMNLLKVPYFYQLIIKGVIIILAVYVDIQNKNKSLSIKRTKPVEPK